MTSPDSAHADCARPEVSVIVPHFRDLKNLDLCLAALERQTYARDRFEIIVGDNNSPEGRDAVEAAIAGRARLAIITDRGAGPARNGAVALARGAVLAFTDSDCRPDPEWLEEALRALAAYDFVGGRMVVTVDDPAHMTPTEAFESIFAFHNDVYVLREGYSVTANLLCSAALFAKVGGFVANGTSEDIEWCLRAGGMGFKIGYAPKAVVRHPARRTWAEMVKKNTRLDVELLALAKLKGRGKLHWAARTLAMPLSAVADTPRTLASPRVNTLGQRLAALSVLYRLRWWRFFDCAKLLFTT